MVKMRVHLNLPTPLSLGASLQSSLSRQFLSEATEQSDHRVIRGLILIVSRMKGQKLVANPNWNTADPLSRRWLVTLGPDKTRDLSGTEIRKDINHLQEAIETGLPPWNWQQLLRAIEPHAKNLQAGHIWLVGSSDDDDAKGSVPAYINHARDFLQGYLPATTFHPVQGVDLEDFDALLRVLRDCAIKPACKNFKLSHKELALDITGGQKIASVAGAVITLNLQVVCQYVRTFQLAGGQSAISKQKPLVAAANWKSEDDPCQPMIYDFRWDDFSI